MCAHLALLVVEGKEANIVAMTRILARAWPPFLVDVPSPTRRPPHDSSERCSEHIMSALGTAEEGKEPSKLNMSSVRGNEVDASCMRIYPVSSTRSPLLPLLGRKDSFPARQRLGGIVLQYSGEDCASKGRRD